MMFTSTYRKGEEPSDPDRLPIRNLGSNAAKTVSGDGFTPAAPTVFFGPK